VVLRRKRKGGGVDGLLTQVCLAVWEFCYTVYRVEIKKLVTLLWGFSDHDVRSSVVLLLRFFSGVTLRFFSGITMG
jgi:hypothetical protein